MVSKQEILSKQKHSVVTRTMTFQDAAIKSAQLYYKYLEEQGGGLIIYRVSKIILDKNSLNRREYWLQLDQKPKNADSLLIRIHNNVYSNEQIKPIVYDKHKRMLKVSLNENTKVVFEKHKPEDVIVFSDLKFLVRRVELWYKQFGNSIKLPTGKQIVPPADCSVLSKDPSSDQTNAITGALSEPFTYIWGAPGTGKTQFVLARAVLAYLQEGKRVLVTAPTNNAVEQTLYGILPVLQEAGLDYNKSVVRLGVASTEFLAQYPGVCEDSGYSKAISEILDNLSYLRLSLEEIAQAEHLYEEYIEFEQQQASFKKKTSAMKKVMSRAIEANTCLTKTQAVADEILSRINQSHNACKEYSNSHDFYNHQAQDLLKRLRNPIFAALSWFSKENEQKKIDETLEKVRYYEEKRDRIQTEINGLNKESKRYQKALTESRTSVEKLLLEAAGYVESYEDLYSVVQSARPETLVEICEKLERICEKKQQIYATKQETYRYVAELNHTYFKERRNQIKQQILMLEQRKANLEQASPNKRVEESLVVACTIDLCLNRLPVSNENNFAHVFLDEAGYSSLIKATTLTAYSDKVTFLGDHMQLPPVCEANDQKIKENGYRLVALWAQSALFTETAFYEVPEKICLDYLNKAQMPFCEMKKFNLVNSYRFGEALARVLADDVYDRDFHGNEGQNTRIFYIDAPKIPGQKRRTNFSECEAIERVLKEYNGLRETSGIIAPYRNQVEILRQMAKRIPFSLDNVITVHQSQGREWENVFLSVTDTTDKFFTNSLSAVSEGKKVINTAVSRARKNLVIVCDYEYWITQRSQLIGKLLAVAQKLNIEKQSEMR